MLRQALLLGLLALCGCRNARLEAVSSPPAVVTLAAVGDLLLDRGVGEKIAREGSGYPFAAVAETLTGADIAFGNLECPLSAKGTRVAKRYSFQARPETVACLVKGGFDLLSLANNHSMDCGRTGLVETMQELERHGIHWCGAGRTRREAETATVLTSKGLRVAFVGFGDFLPEGSFLRDDRPTIAFAGAERVRAAVAAARSRADVVVASFHWGIEYESRPHPRQEALAEAAVRAGADLVLGHHPHVLQGLEIVPSGGARGGRPALIAYSLGNFLFDRRTGRALQSVILRCALTRRGLAGAELTPVQLDPIRPRPASGPVAQTILARLARLSAERNTRVDGGRILVESPL
jgi:poly-gamma-glutamate capsule biosynthesis protein CapA/YwtB (metallophosphatase superfamily)